MTDLSICNIFGFKKTATNLIYCNSANETQTLSLVADHIISNINNNQSSESCYHVISSVTLIRYQAICQFVNVLINNHTGYIKFGASVKQLVICQLQLLCNSGLLSDLHTVISCLTEEFFDVPPCLYNYVDMWEDYNVETLASILTPKTGVLMIPHVCYTTGLILDVKEIARVARSVNPNMFIIVEGSLYVPHRPLDVTLLDVDMYTFTFKRFYGPRATVAYLRHNANIDLRDEIVPNDYNIFAIKGVDTFIRRTINKREETTLYRADIERFYDQIQRHEGALQAHMDFKLTTQLSHVCTRVTNNAHTEYVPIYGLRFKRTSHTYVALFLNECNILCDHIHNKLVQLPHNNVVRLSFGFYNTDIDINYVTSILKEFDTTPLKSSQSYTKLFINLFHSSSETLMHMMSIYKEDQLKYAFDEMHRDTVHSHDFKVFRLYSVVYLPMFVRIGHARHLPSNRIDYDEIIVQESDLHHYGHSNLLTLPFVKRIVGIFAESIYERIHRYINYVHLHQVRLDLGQLNNHNMLQEFFHSSGLSQNHTYMGIMCVRRENICGGKLDILNKDTAVVNNTYMLAHGQLIIVNLRQTECAFSEVEKVSYAEYEAFIDLIVLLSVF